MNDLAWILQGEAGICGLQAMLAVAWVYSRNPVFYGRQQPGRMARFVARHWRAFPDPTDGAYYLVNDLDLRDPRVQAFASGDPVATFECASGRRLYAYRRVQAHNVTSFLSPPSGWAGGMGEPLAHLPRWE